MPIGTRFRDNNVFGATEDNPLTSSASSFNSLGLVNLSVIATNHAVITLDPLRQFGNPEIVVVTVHTAASTIASITRGAYGTSPREHPQGTLWVHAPLDEDFIEITTSAARPLDPYRGQAIFETDTNRYVSRSTADAWQQLGLFFDPPHCALTQTAATSHSNNGAWQLVGGGTPSGSAWDTEIDDTAAMHSTVTNPARITVPIAGLYLLVANVAFSTNTTNERAVSFRKNALVAGPNIPGRSIVKSGAAVECTPSASAVVRLVANDFVEVMAFQNSGGTLAYTVIPAEFTMYFSVTYIGRGNTF